MATYDHDQEENDYVPPWEQDPATYEEVLALIEAEEDSNTEAEDRIIDIYCERTGKTKQLALNELNSHQKNRYGIKQPDTHTGRLRELRNSREPSLTMKLKLDRFVQEYVKDFNGKQAALRIGVPEGSAQQQAHAWLGMNYVVRTVSEWLHRVDEEVLLDRRRIILGLMQEAQYFGQGSSHAARVAAWAKLAKLTGMDIDRVQAEVTFHHVMRVPERSLDVSSWEQEASKEQQRLKHDVRN